MAVNDPTFSLLWSLTGQALESRRVVLSRLLHQQCQGVVQRGPLTGFTLETEASWGGGDVAAKLFGLYEQEVLAVIDGVRGRKPVLLNLGAADGYYGVGMVATGIVARAVCWEITDAGRTSITQTAERNRVGDRVHVLGAATPDFFSPVAAAGIQPSDCFVLVDVEGAEYDIFTDSCLESLCHAELLIELHEFVADGVAKAEDLIARAGRLFDTRVFAMGARDPGQIPALRGLSDNDRWLLCSESRPHLMRWLHLTPRSSS